MLDTKTIKKLFHALNEELLKKKVIGEIGICGGAVMCLVFNARESVLVQRKLEFPGFYLRDKRLGGRCPPNPLGFSEASDGTTT